METIDAKACPQDSPELLLAGLLQYLSQNSLLSHWYRIWDRSDDYPASEVRRLTNEDELHKIDQLNKMSLQNFVGIEHDHWIWLLKSYKLVKENTDGDISFTTEDKWKEFLREYDIDAEVEAANCLRTNKRRYIRLGLKTDNWHESAPLQARKNKFSPPRCPNIGVIGRRLNKDLQFRIEEERNDEEDDWGDTGINDTDVDISDDANSNECADECTDKYVAECADTGEAATAKPCASAHHPFPLLQCYGLADLDLSDETDCNRFKRILGEMVAKQQQHTKEKNVVEYFQLAQNKSTTAVAVRPHKSDDAFQSYHRGNPYLKDAVRCLDKDVKVGALRLSGNLAKHHKDEFIDAANASGVAVTGVLNATESAALYTEAELGDEQWNTIMRHLRNKFDAKIACSLLDLKRKCYEGYTMPRVKVIYHRAGQKDEEKIKAEYQDIKAEFKKAVETLLRVNRLKNRKQVKRIRLIIGGDHGQGAFRLGFRVLIDTEGGKSPMCKTINIATVYCKKEVGAILESTVIDWLAEDLKQIHDNPLHLLNLDGRAVCCFECDMDNLDDVLLEPIQVEQLIAGDLAWECFCLGKEGAANSWCIYCMLGPQQWSIPNHDRGQCWTMEDLNEMADSDKKGAKRMGVKRRSYFPWIPLKNYILPILHLCIGLGNDVIDYFGFLVEWRLTKLSDEEKRWKNRVDELNVLIPNQRKVVNDWKAGNHGKRRTALMALRRTRAPSNGGNGLNHDEVDELAALDATFEAMGKLRDTLIAERKSLNTKIDAKHEERRRPPEGVQKTWYLEMERIYRNHNVKREDYHKRKFQGRPLKKIMQKAEAIFTDAKTMLREFKDDSVADIDAKIDETCDEIISLLRSWGEVFHIFYTKKPSAEDKDKFKNDMADAVAKHRALRAKVDDNNDTPKLHCAEDHGLEAIENHPDLSLCIEEWVEQFHQTERKKVEAKCKFEKDPEKHAQLAARKRAGMNNADIMAQCRDTKRPRRGPYKKR
mmetsp:Transcript_24585/g.38594  ORF Transcript_24585/g.38594 Transcript_24585/m.38594 type:complete len:992 (+) Transcript_24585:233-3208(+)